MKNGTANAAALLSFAGAAIHACGFAASDLALMKGLDGLGVWAAMLLFSPFGIGLAVVGFLEGAAAVGLLGGGIMLLRRRRSGIRLTVAASGAACVTGALLITRIIPAPFLFGKTVAGLPSYSLVTVVAVFVLALAAVTMALAVAGPTLRSCSRQGSSSRPCSMA
ncbi:hypothetical protein [Mycobacterium palustre]|uniref:Uncharacterized protein n=1 Tax=Mycobacterium palustre TaxID=153971 RepID=A0A1X1ZR97_9MYCO|nr:hypothetical protein [Mycobacterium palustre]MCV7102637.1 hypothetical protein [Mycobacterium palustre]ORW25873.1 hypothetical protein AWC19_05985 [Mycobacterium palustre]